MTFLLHILPVIKKKKKQQQHWISQMPYFMLYCIVFFKFEHSDNSVFWLPETRNS